MTQSIAGEVEPATKFSAALRPRIAGFVTAWFPDFGQDAAYAELDRVAAALGAEHQVAYWAARAPQQLPPAARKLVNSGFFLPQSEAIAHSAIDFAKEVLADRYAKMVEWLAAVGFDEEQARERFDFRMACTAARLLRTWQVDAVMSWHSNTTAAVASLAAFLLDVPHIAVLRTLSGTEPTEIELLLRARASLLLTTSKIEARLSREVVSEPHGELRVLPADGPTNPEVVAQIRALLAKDRAVPFSTPGELFRLGRPQSPVPVTRSRPFLILGAERTGSNMLADMIRSQQGFGCAGELYNPSAIEQGKLHWLRHDSPVANYLELRRRDPCGLHRQLMRDADREGLRWAGFKLMYYHAAIDDRVVDFLAAMPDMPIIHLTRRDRLARHVSQIRSEESAVWFQSVEASRTDAAALPRSVTVDIEKALHGFANVATMEQLFRTVFDRHPILELVYEDVIADPAGTMQQLGRFFGEEFVSVTPRTAKTGRHVAELVDNYGELRSALAGTCFAHLVDDAVPVLPQLPGSGRYYQDLDVGHFDYCLAPVPQTPGLICRGPMVDVRKPFIACIGAAQTFGRFIETPFPSLLGSALDCPALNLGIGGIGPRFWLSPVMVDLLSRARLVVVQVMAGRSSGNSMFDNSAGGDLWGTEVSTGERMRFEDFLGKLVARGDQRLLRRIVGETRMDYIESMRQLGAALGVPTVLLWFSGRAPEYAPDWRNANSILNQFPQLLDGETIAAIKPSFDRYVEVVTTAGIPQRLWQTDQAVPGSELGADGFAYNRYYPSPEMHQAVAERLIPVCRELLGE